MRGWVIHRTLVVAVGHTPQEARLWASKLPAFRKASPEAVFVLAQAEARRWEDLVSDGVPDIDAVAKGARAWADL